jgi:hypothetical protein
MKLKGQSTIPFTVIEAATTMLLILMIVYGNQAHTNDFVKQETLDLQADRVTNAALALNSVPEGFVEVDMSGYQMKYEDSNITMKYNDKELASEIDQNMINYDNIQGPSDFKKVNGTVCLRKTESNQLIIAAEAC